MYIGKEQQHIQVNNLTIRLPNGESLIKQLNITFQSGVSYLIQDKSGTGKSVFLRAVAGIWPYADGEIFLPKNKSIYFLPQKPYLPYCSLKEILLSENKMPCDDEKLTAVLEEVQLQKYLPYLNKDKNWQHVLSLGEQQRLFLAQIFIKNPDIIFLDEATSALDEDAEANFYQALKNRLPLATIISVGHRASLRRFHQRALMLTTKKSIVITENDLVDAT